MAAVYYHFKGYPRHYLNIRKTWRGLFGETQAAAAAQG
jgi:hypothetical protein